MIISPYVLGRYYYIIIPILLEKLRYISQSLVAYRRTVLASTTTLLNCSRNCVIHFILFTILFRSLEDNLSLEFLVYIENKIRNNLEFSFKNSILLVFNGQKG